MKHWVIDLEEIF